MANAQSASSSDWMKSQQQYWDTWFDAQRKYFTEQWPAMAASQQNPWGDFFKEWGKAVGGSEGASTEAFQQYFAKAGEGFLNMMQQFTQPGGGGGASKTPGQMAQEWAEQMQKCFAGALQPGKDPFAACDPFGFYAAMPGIGYTREKQEQWGRLYRQWAEFERKSRDYNASMAKVGLEAVQKFQDYLARPPAEAQPLKSLKDIYVKWVDVCEEIYARYAMTEEYTRLYGETVNALMAFKKQLNEMTDDLADQFNLPTRREVDSLHERLHALRRENQQLKKDVATLMASLKPGAKPKKPAAKRKKA